jgi:hypothetical protein
LIVLTETPSIHAAPFVPYPMTSGILFSWPVIPTQTKGIATHATLKWAFGNKMQLLMLGVNAYSSQ